MTQAELEAQAREIGKLLAHGMPPGVGFTLLVFDFGPEGSLAYISNANRRDMLNALKEFLVKVELET